MRADKWLWHARFFKTRTLATRFVGNGNLRINATKQTRASAQLRVGDVLVFGLNDHIRTIEVVALSSRRGPAPEAQTLYIDRDPPRPKTAEEKNCFSTKWQWSTNQKATPTNNRLYRQKRRWRLIFSKQL